MASKSKPSFEAKKAYCAKVRRPNYLASLRLEGLSVESEDCQRLLSIPSVGLLSATAMVASIGDISAFKNGRELAA